MKSFTDNKTHVAVCMGISLVLLMITASAQTKKKPLAGLNWMIGKWTMQVKSGTLYEVWHKVNDSTFQSAGYLVKKAGDTTINETVQLTSRKGVIYYTSTVKGQNDDKPVPFKIISVKSNAFVASNPEHDYPQQIGYTLESPTALYAWIDGKEKGVYKKIDYRMKKVSPL